MLKETTRLLKNLVVVTGLIQDSAQKGTDLGGSHAKRIAVLQLIQHAGTTEQNRFQTLDKSMKTKTDKQHEEVIAKFTSFDKTMEKHDTDHQRLEARGIDHQSGWSHWQNGQINRKTGDAKRLH